ncbi:hypothetical protein Trydic_g3198 [Trypoxylus dichotomus]
MTIPCLQANVNTMFVTYERLQRLTTVNSRPTLHRLDQVERDSMVPTVKLGTSDNQDVVELVKSLCGTRTGGIVAAAAVVVVGYPAVQRSNVLLFMRGRYYTIASTTEEYPPAFVFIPSIPNFSERTTSATPEGAL